MVGSYSDFHGSNNVDSHNSRLVGMGAMKHIVIDILERYRVGLQSREGAMKELRMITSDERIIEALISDVDNGSYHGYEKVE